MVSNENLANDSQKRDNIEFDLANVPARVDRVYVSGLLRTHNDYIMQVARDLFKATNFEDLMLETMRAKYYLQELGIFKDVSVYVDISHGETATPNGYEVTFKGKELSRIVGSVGTEIGQNEGSLRTELTMPNLFGRGESISVQGSYSSKRANDLQLKFWKPFFHTRFVDNRPEISLSIFRHLERFDVSRFQNINLGFLTDFTVKTKLLLPLTHSIQYETSIRELSLTDKKVPMVIREHCGPKLASLVRYSLVYDQRDNAVFPNHGVFFKTNNEFSGLGGNISYMSTCSHGEINLPIFNDLVMQICGRIGIIKETKWTTTLPISQLYYCGGPLTLRGFKYGGAGPFVNDIHMGAKICWSTGFHMWAPLPFYRAFKGLADNFRTHLFYNVGNFNTFSLENMRSAAGIGLAFKLANRARVELNYCIPIRNYAGDSVQNGFQFGIGYEFV